MLLSGLGSLSSSLKLLLVHHNVLLAELRFGRRVVLQNSEIIPDIIHSLGTVCVRKNR